MNTFYPFQIEGVEWAVKRLARQHGVIIGDEMGLGKTVQALGVINELRPMHVLIVCLSSIKINWRREALKWLEDEYKVHTIDGQGGTAYTPGFPLVSIINYDVLMHTDFSNCEYDLVIYDECHKMKTPDAKRTTAAARIVTKKRLLLTGTPIINRPKEIWQLMVLCGVAYPADFHAFGLKYCGARQIPEFRSQGRGANRKVVRALVWNYDGATNLEELHYWLYKLCMIRRLKRNVLPDLPAKTRQIIELPNPFASDVPALSVLQQIRQRQSYEQVVNNLDAEVNIAFEQISLVRHETALAKVGPAFEHIYDVLDGTKKLVLFAHHRDVIQLLSEGLQAGRFGHSTLVGGMTDTKKQAAVDQFVNDPDCRVFIGQIQAAGTGVDGLQEVCSHAIFVELDWSPGVMSQTEDRLARIGQEEPVLIQHLVFDQSIDAKIAKALTRKQSTLDKVLDGAFNANINWVKELA